MPQDDPDKENDEIYLASGLAGEDPPVRQEELVRDAVIYAAAGLAFGLSVQVMVRRELFGALFGFLGKVPLIWWDNLFRIAMLIPLPLLGLAALGVLAGFGALFFRAGPERGLARVFAFGFAMMAGRLLLMP